jgi:putative oxidoreductase
MSTTATTPASSPSKGLHYTLWALQGLLALMMFGAGAWKATAPLEELTPNLPWVALVPGWVPRLAGGSEVLGAIGLVVPAATGILPVLTPVAAACLALVMGLAVVMHLALGEGIGAAIPAVVLGSLFAFVAWGRATKAPVTR